MSKRKNSEKNIRKKNRKLKRLKRTAKKVDKKIRGIGTNTPNIAKQFDMFRKLPQYQDNRESVYRWYIQEGNSYIDTDLRMVARLTSKGWNKNKAQDLHDLVVTKTYSQFRQKYKPPSDFYGLLLEEWTPQEIERGMNMLNQMDWDLEPDVISELIDLLDSGVF